jgi:hypothetical protein
MDFQAGEPFKGQISAGMVQEGELDNLSEGRRFQLWRFRILQCHRDTNLSRDPWRTKMYPAGHQIVCYFRGAYMCRYTASTTARLRKT